MSSLERLFLLLVGSWVLIASGPEPARAASQTEPGPGTAVRLVIGVPVSTVGGAALAVGVTALDRFDNVARGYAGTVRVTSSDPLATLTDTVTLANGVGVFKAVLRTWGAQTLTVTDTRDRALAGASHAIAVTATAATRFVVSAPEAGTAGSAVAFVVAALDAFGNPATAFNGGLRLRSGDRAASLPADVTLVDSVGTFSATFRTAGRQTLTVVDADNDGVAGTSLPMTISPGAVTRFEVAATTTAVAGTAFPVTVTALDRFDNVVVDHVGAVRLRSSDDLVDLPAEATLVRGVGSFTATLKTAGPQVVTASSGDGALSGASPSIAVSHGPPARLAIATPSGVTAGDAFSVTVMALDAFDNIATDYEGPVRIVSSDDGAVVAADATWTDGVGVLGVTLRTAGSHVVTATDASDAAIAVDSDPIAVSAGVAAQLHVELPSLIVPGVTFFFTVTAVDRFDNVATSHVGSVFLVSDEPGVTLPPVSLLVGGTGTFPATVETPGPVTIVAADVPNPTIVGKTVGDTFVPVAPDVAVAVPTLGAGALALLALLLVSAGLRVTRRRARG